MEDFMTNELFPALSTAEEDALALISAATNISRTRSAGDKTELTIALDENLQLWTAIQTVVSREGHPMPRETRDNLLKLAQFVVAKTIAEGCDASDKTLDTLENLNMQIAQGLMENLRLPALKENAQALLQCAQDMTEAAARCDNAALIAALDENLNVWIALKTLTERKDMPLTSETEQSILKLADFTIKKTLELGRERNDETLSTLININLQIAAGFLESRPLSAAESDALALLNAALRLSEAKETSDASGLVQALENNLELWTGIRTLINAKNHPMAKETRENLTRLADFTVQKTFEIGADTSNPTIDTLINVNLQISEGLLERIRYAA
jgi:flagellar biosynthesis regulator FlaF